MERLKQDNEAKTAKLAAKVKPITFKVGEKGGVCVYGLGRFPTSLYAQQWLRIIDPAVIADLKQFIVDHAGELATKD